MTQSPLSSSQVQQIKQCQPRPHHTRPQSATSQELDARYGRDIIMTCSHCHRLGVCPSHADVLTSVTI